MRAHLQKWPTVLKRYRYGYWNRHRHRYEHTDIHRHTDTQKHTHTHTCLRCWGLNWASSLLSYSCSTYSVYRCNILPKSLRHTPSIVKYTPLPTKSHILAFCAGVDLRACLYIYIYIYLYICEQFVPSMMPCGNRKQEQGTLMHLVAPRGRRSFFEMS